MADLYFGGGLNQNDEFNISLEECYQGQNFDLNERTKTFRPRLPFDQVGTLPNGACVSGIMQLIKRDDQDSLLVSGGNAVYQMTDTFTATGVATVNTSTGLRSTYWSLDDRIIITDLDLNNTLAKWDGSEYTKHKHGIGDGTVTTAVGITRTGTTATLTYTAHGLVANDLFTVFDAVEIEYNGEHIIDAVTEDTIDFTVSGTPSTPATGTITFEKSVDLYAKYAIEHENRIWLFNIQDVNGATTSLNPHMMLVSEFEDVDSFDIATRAGTATATGLTGNEAFYMLTPDLRPINGVVKFLNTLIISTIDGGLFRITGSSPADFQIVPFYAGSAATGQETMSSIGNDVLYMTSAGDIESLSSTDRFGDVKADDVSRFIHDELRDLDDAITVYNQDLQKIYLFVTDKVLVLDKGILLKKPNISPWSVYRTSHNNSFNACAVSYIRKPGSNQYDIYWGDHYGGIFKMNGTPGNGDAGIYDLITYRKTRLIRETPSEFINQLGKVEYRRRGIADLIVTFTYDGSGVNSSVRIPLRDTQTTGNPNFWSGDAYWGGDYYWDEGEVVEDVISKKNFSPTGKGEGFFIECRLNTSVNFLINRLSIPPYDSQAT